MRFIKWLTGLDDDAFRIWLTDLKYMMLYVGLGGAVFALLRWWPFGVAP